MKEERNLNLPRIALVCRLATAVVPETFRTTTRAPGSRASELRTRARGVDKSGATETLYAFVDVPLPTKILTVPRNAFICPQFP